MRKVGMLIGHVSQGFLTAVLQRHARSQSVAIDDLTLRVTVTKEANPEALASPAKQGVFIHGLWIDGARWDNEAECLADPLPGVMVAALPVVNITPVNDTSHAQGGFMCPLYKTSDRTGALSTTGQSTNFVSTLSLPTQKGTPEDHWVLRGVALLCCLDE
jgi:dynein heavy chain, axonemal